MATSNRTLFTHPVLSLYNDDYVNVKFNACTTGELSKTARKSTIKMIVEVDDKSINEMLDSKKFKIITKVFCATTKFRKIFEIDRGLSEIVIDNRNINKNVELETFIIAAEDIENFSSNNFNDDYKGMSFNLEVGEIVAVGKSENVYFEKDINEFTKVDSIVKIRNSGKSDVPMSVSIDDEKIKIVLAKEDYELYCMYSEYCIPIVNSMIIIPGLMYTLEQISSAGAEIDDYKDKKWFRVINKKVFELTGNELTKEYIISHGTLIIIQLLFDCPIHDAMLEIENKYGGGR